MSDKYILDARGEPVAVNSLLVWAQWMEDDTHNGNLRRVGETWIGDDVRVSTVFLGLDYSFGAGPPVLWETMVFSPKNSETDHMMRRCSGSREQADAMHEDVVMQLTLGTVKKS